MDLQQVETNLQNPNFQYRLQAISALKTYSSEVAVPILCQHIQDSEFLVRTFVARELGRHITSEAYAALLQMVKLDDTPNVRAEAANSLSLSGKIAAAHLVQTFFQDDHWLVRRSILGALVEMDCPAEVLEVCLCGLKAEDAAVQETSVDALGALAQTPLAVTALEQLLALAKSPYEYLRVRVAYALKHFNAATAKAALVQLRNDPDHRVVGAAMEDLLT